MDIIHIITIENYHYYYEYYNFLEKKKIEIQTKRLFDNWGKYNKR